MAGDRHNPGRHDKCEITRKQRGRTIEQKKKLVEEITRITVEVLGGTPDAVDILITDVKRENWATGGKLWSEPRN